MVNEGDKSNMHKNLLMQRVAKQTAYVSHELYVFQSMSFCQTLRSKETFSSHDHIAETDKAIFAYFICYFHLFSLKGNLLIFNLPL
jgi:hypothetical protein